MTKAVSITAALLSSFLACSADAEVIRGTGGSMSFDIGYGIIINEGSTLNREWVIVTDKQLPAKLLSFDVETRLRDRNWIYDISYQIDVSEYIEAIEVRFIPFDIWGDTGRALSATDIQDFPAGNHDFSAQWNILSENDAVSHYAMLGYVAQVKLASGEILRANPDAVVREAQKFSEDFSSGDLSTDE